ncbi:hypothetical protein [Amantichitinum ursilacus]|uniref:hypothetical protein n=1 Tax=Amantichitinum ursilacus TaxID=857265 RepID=UPI0013792D5C|nr:hypothetical protein [Amantichitinum ursilacus]
MGSTLGAFLSGGAAGQNAGQTECRKWEYLTHLPPDKRSGSISGHRAASKAMHALRADVIVSLQVFAAARHQKRLHNQKLASG